MDYYIDIIDTTDDGQVLIEEFASRSGLVLSWNGADAKDDLQIVGSNLAFDMAAPNLSMGHFLHLFTGNETKYRVEVKKESDDSLIWKGFLLPDTYKEPYTNNIPFINVTASDGLGRLKGKYLPDDYYTSEKSVIEVLQACLAATSVILPLRFKPAIEHVSFKKWHEIYIDGTLLVQGNKKQNCYQILEDLFKLHVIYQNLGYWYVEGLNVRHLAALNYDSYDVDGNYLGEVEHGRIIKQVENKMFEAPLVTMVPAYKKVSVSYDIEQPKLPDNIVQENNDGWSASVTEFIYADAFFPHNGESFAIASAYSEYKVRFYKDYSASPDTTRKMSLVSPVYVDVGQEVTVEMDFDISVFSGSIDSEVTSLKVQITLNGNVLHEVTLFNDPDIEEEDDRILTYLKEAFLIDEPGYLDVFIFRPVSNGRNSIIRDGWQLKTFKVFVINQEKEFWLEDEITDDYTIEKEVPIVYADEFIGLNKSFLLEKLQETVTETYNQNITVYNEFVSNGKRYIQLKLKDANLCDAYRKGLYASSTNIGVVNVVYNWLGSTDEHMVEIDTPINGAQAYVQFQKKYSGGVDRSAWQSWTDSIYKIENERYGKIVANIYRRMFLEPHEKIDGTAKKLISFNDLVSFMYIDSRRYVPTNLSLNLDNGSTNVTMALNYYHDNSGGVSTNISPILNVIADFCIGPNDTQLDLTSEAFDPDGFIVKHFWSITTGSGFIADLNQPNITVVDLPLNIDEFIFRCRVEDNDGAIVTKDVRVCRTSGAEVSVNYQCGNIISGGSVPPSGSGITGDAYRKGVTLGLDASMTADRNFNVKLKVEGLLCSALTLDDPLNDSCSNSYSIEDSRLWRLYGAGVRVFKNGLAVGSHQVFHPDRLAEGFVNFNMNSSDTILIMIYGYKSNSDYMNTRVTIEEMREVNGAVEISNEGLQFYLTSQFTLQ